MAKAMDNSDLVLRLQGPAVDAESPRLQIVTQAFTDIRDQVQRIAKAIIGLSPDTRGFPRHVELGLSGLAKGSLIVGVRVQTPEESQRGQTRQIFSGGDDQVYQAVRLAVRQLAIVTQHISDEGVDESLKEEIPDPGVRDIVVLSAQRLAPSGKRGIDRISLFSSELESGKSLPLTPQIKRSLKRVVANPVNRTERGEFAGTVREIDLDARRFEIRGVRGAGAVRCIYPESYARAAHHWLDSEVLIKGFFERSTDGNPRLVEADHVEVLKKHKQADIFD